MKCGTLTAFASILLTLSAVHADYVYVTETGTDTIRRFDAATGADLGIFAHDGLHGPEGITIDSRGNLYVGNGNNGTVQKISPTGNDLGTIGSVGITSPLALAVDQADNVYVADYFTGQIRKYDSAGNDHGVLVSTGFTRLGGIAIDADGNLYAANFYPGGYIQKYSPAGIDLGTFATAGLAQVTGLTFDHHGNLFAATYDGIVRQFSPTGQDLGNYVSTLYYPWGIDLDSAGNLFAVNYYYTNTLQKYAPDGTDLGTIATGNTIWMGVAIAHIPEPASLALLTLAATALLIRRRQNT